MDEYEVCGYEVEVEDSPGLGRMYNLEAEQAVIGGLLLAPDRYSEIEGALDPEDFYQPAYAVVYAAMQGLQAEGKVVDILLLRDELNKRGDLGKAGGVSALSSLTDIVPTGVQVAHYAGVVRDYASRRRLLSLCGDVSAQASRSDSTTLELIDHAEKGLFAISAASAGDEPRNIKGLVKDVFAQVEARVRHEGAVHGVETHYFELDQMLTGLHGGELIIIAGRPSMGKSTFALNVGRRVAMDSKAVAIFSLEMTAVNMAQNMVAAQGRIDGQHIRTGELTTRDFDAMAKAMKELATAPIFIDDSCMLSVGQLRGKARRLKKKHDIQLIIIDYLQLMTPSSRSRGRSREQEVAEISRGIKSLSKELDIPVICLSQLSRKPEGRADPRPILSDLRESGAIEQDADVVGFIHRPEYYSPGDAPGQAEVIIAKQRNGPTGTVHLSFLKNQLRFEPLSQEAAARY